MDIKDVSEKRFKQLLKRTDEFFSALSYMKTFLEQNEDLLERMDSKHRKNSLELSKKLISEIEKISKLRIKDSKGSREEIFQKIKEIINHVRDELDSPYDKFRASIYDMYDEKEFMEMGKKFNNIPVSKAMERVRISIINIESSSYVKEVVLRSKSRTINQHDKVRINWNRRSFEYYKNLIREKYYTEEGQEKVLPEINKEDFSKIILYMVSEAFKIAIESNKIIQSKQRSILKRKRTIEITIIQKRSIYMGFDPYRSEENFLAMNLEENVLIWFFVNYCIYCIKRRLDIKKSIEKYTSWSAFRRSTLVTTAVHEMTHAVHSTKTNKNFEDIQKLYDMKNLAQALFIVRIYKMIEEGFARFNEKLIDIKGIYKFKSPLLLKIPEYKENLYKIHEMDYETVKKELISQEARVMSYDAGHYLMNLIAVYNILKHKGLKISIFWMEKEKIKKLSQVYTEKGIDLGILSGKNKVMNIASYTDHIITSLGDRTTLKRIIKTTEAQRIKDLKQSMKKEGFAVAMLPDSKRSVERLSNIIERVMSLNVNNFVKYMDKVYDFLEFPEKDRIISTKKVNYYLKKLEQAFGDKTK